VMEGHPAGAGSCPKVFFNSLLTIDGRVTARARRERGSLSEIVFVNGRGRVRLPVLPTSLAAATGDVCWLRPRSGAIIASTGEYRRDAHS
jgi:hypothetical protein